MQGETHKLKEVGLVHYALGLKVHKGVKVLLQVVMLRAGPLVWIPTHPHTGRCRLGHLLRMHL